MCVQMNMESRGFCSLRPDFHEIEKYQILVFVTDNGFLQA